jgi:Domain of unknown function (DUF4296)
MKYTILAALIISIISCTGSVTIPPDVIPKKNMETIIWQLIQSDEYATSVITKDSAKNAITERIRLYQEVFALNKVSKEEFKKSYQFYLGHPDIAKVMFDSIAARGTRQKADAYKSKVKVAKP